MFTSFRARNFRCFEDLEVGPLGRINLITGANNVGKTALLEGVFLLMGGHGALNLMEFHGLRGHGLFTEDPAELWRWLFLDRHVERSASLRGERPQGSGRELTLAVSSAPRDIAFPTTTVSYNPSDAGSPPSPAEVAQLTFTLEDEGRPFQAKAWADGSDLRYGSVEGEGTWPQCQFLTTGKTTDFLEGRLFTKFQDAKRLEFFIRALRSLDSRLQDIRLGFSGSAPALACDLGLDELVPMALCGEGMQRLLAILMRVVDASGGAFLLDEMENGLHHSVLPKAWRLIADAAREADTQVFATTHSWECVEAAHEVFKEADDFRLHRLEKRRDRIVAVTYPPEAFDAAVRANLEVR